jgi:hypothetical protein
VTPGTCNTTALFGFKQNVREHESSAVCRFRTSGPVTRPVRGPENLTQWTHSKHGLSSPIQQPFLQFYRARLSFSSCWNINQNALFRGLQRLEIFEIFPANTLFICASLVTKQWDFFTRERTVKAWLLIEHPKVHNTHFTPQDWADLFQSIRTITTLLRSP